MLARISTISRVFVRFVACSTPPKKPELNSNSHLSLKQGPVHLSGSFLFNAVRIVNTTSKFCVKMTASMFIGSTIILIGCTVVYMGPVGITCAVLAICFASCVKYLLPTLISWESEIPDPITFLAVASFDAIRTKILPAAIRRALILPTFKITPQTITNILLVYSFDEGRIDALRIIVGYLDRRLTGKDLNTIVNVFTGGHSRLQCLEILISATKPLTKEDVSTMLRVFVLNDERREALRILTTK